MITQGKLIGLARAPVHLAPLQELAAAIVTVERGIEGDARGSKQRRQISVLFAEDWLAACHDVPLLEGRTLPWVTRRANLLVEGLPNPRALGTRITIGNVVLEVVCETEPCALMEKAQVGLRAAMEPDWRGGVCCKVILGGQLALGARVSAG